MFNIKILPLGKKIVSVFSENPEVFGFYVLIVSTALAVELLASRRKHKMSSGSLSLTVGCHCHHLLRRLKRHLYHDKIPRESGGLLRVHFCCSFLLLTSDC